MILEITPPISTTNLKNTQPVQNFRTEILNAVSGHRPIYLSRYSAQGDRFITAAAAKTVISRLCQEENVDESGLRLASYPLGCPPDGIVDFPQSVRQITGSDFLTYHMFQNKLVGAGFALGVQIDYQDFATPPSPVIMDYAPMDAFNQEKIAEAGSALRAQLSKDHDAIWVIAQSGSNPSKRFSDDQVGDLLDLATHLSDNPALVVVSDRKLLKQEIEKQNINTLKKKFSSGSELFEAKNPYEPFVKIPNFLSSLADNPFADKTDIVDTAEDINDLGSYFFAADYVLTTDTFWAWFGAGVNPSNSKFVLHAVGDPRRWAIPTAHVTESDAIGFYRRRNQIWRNGVISGVDYSDYNSERDNVLRRVSKDLVRGIHSRDMTRFAAEIVSVLS